MHIWISIRRMLHHMCPAASLSMHIFLKFLKHHISEFMYQSSWKVDNVSTFSQTITRDIINSLIKELKLFVCNLMAEVCQEVADDMILPSKQRFYLSPSSCYQCYGVALKKYCWGLHICKTVEGRQCLAYEKTKNRNITISSGNLKRNK